MYVATYLDVHVMLQKVSRCVHTAVNVLVLTIPILIFLAFKRQVIYHFSHISCLSRSVYLWENGFCEYKVSIIYDNKAK